MTAGFGPYELDLERRQLLHEGEPVHLSPKAFQLLQLLLEARPRVLSKTEITERLWPETFVADSNLSSLVKELRRALHDEARAPHYIRTAHGYGYAFCADKTSLTDKRSSRVPVARLLWPAGEAMLFEGRNVIGRGLDAAASIDDRTVSRYHAAIIISDAGMILEDLNSKNGTFVGASRLTAPVALRDGSTFAVGSVQVALHLVSDQSTRTL